MPRRQSEATRRAARSSAPAPRVVMATSSHRSAGSARSPDLAEDAPAFADALTDSEDGPPSSRRPLMSESRQLRPHDSPESRAPFGRVLLLGERSKQLGWRVGLVGAFLVHGAAASYGATALIDIGAFVTHVQNVTRETARQTFAVQVEQKLKPPPPPEVEPPKPALTQPKVAAPSTTEPPQEAPPAAAEAGKVMTAEPDPNEPLDLTDQGFISGNGDRFAGGVTAATGTSKSAVSDLRARPGGVPGGTGKGPAQAPRPPPDKDLSRPATPAIMNWEDCGFPPEADVEQIDYMQVRIVVTVGVDGHAKKVSVLGDPGHGFGNLARQCGLRKTYNPAYNLWGQAIESATPPIRVTFRR